MIILRTPKGWRGPKEEDGLKPEELFDDNGFSHQFRGLFITWRGGGRS